MKNISMRSMDKVDDALASDDIDREDPMEQPSEEKKFQQQINMTHNNILSPVEEINTEMSDTLGAAGAKTGLITSSFKPVTDFAATAKTDAMRDAMSQQMRQVNNQSDVFNPFRSQIDQEMEEEQKISQSQSSIDFKH